MSTEVTTYEWGLANRILGHTSIVGARDVLRDAADRLAARKVQAGNQPGLVTA